jgi:phage antirepressor YoqD-like protein
MKDFETVTILEVAKLFEVKDIKLREWLKDNKYIRKDNRPRTRYIELDIMDFILEEVDEKPHYVTLITGKGIKFFQSKYFQN